MLHSRKDKNIQIGRDREFSDRRMEIICGAHKSCGSHRNDIVYLFNHEHVKRYRACNMSGNVHCHASMAIPNL